MMHWWFALQALAASPIPIQTGDWGAACAPIPTDGDRFLWPGVPGNALDLVFVDLVDYPRARCNDGTVASYYVRPGAGSDADRWVLHLQGAGACDTHERCLARWCSTGTNYSGDFMTSSESTPTIRGGGILDPDPVLNRFATWTHVFARYCTSDTWLGSTSDAVLDDPSGDAPSIRLAFEGRAVFDAIVDELVAGPSKLTSLGMPRLSDAQQVLLTGSTSGATGAIFHGDGLAARLPDADVRLVLDSTLYPTADLLAGQPYSGQVRPEDEDAFRRWGAAWPLWAVPDPPDCAAAHPGDDAWRCADRMHLATHHLATPFFVHSDQLDPEAPMCGGAHDETERPPCPQDIVDQMLALADIATPGPDREGPPAYDPTAPLPGFHAPRCGFDSHAAMATHHDRLGFFETRVDWGTDGWLSFHDVLSNWVDGEGPTAVHQPLSAVDCPDPPPTVVSGVEVSVLDEILDLRWQPSTHATHYTVHRVIWADPVTPRVVPPAIAEVDLPEAQVLAEAPRSCLAVEAHSPRGSSGPSGIVCVDVPAPVLRTTGCSSDPRSAGIRWIGILALWGWRRRSRGIVRREIDDAPTERPSGTAFGDDRKG